jgi:hypothetical protein
LCLKQQKVEKLVALHGTFVAKAKSDFTTLERMMMDREEAICARMKLAAEEEQRVWTHTHSWSFDKKQPRPEAGTYSSRLGGLLQSAMHSIALPMAPPRENYLMQLGLPPLQAPEEAWAEHLGQGGAR